MGLKLESGRLCFQAVEAVTSGISLSRRVLLFQVPLSPRGPRSTVSPREGATFCSCLSRRNPGPSEVRLRNLAGDSWQRVKRESRPSPAAPLGERNRSGVGLGGGC